MTLIFHGVRGSHPVADAEMMRYGGNTSCVEIVKTNKQGIKVPVIIDSGSGIINFGYQLAGLIFGNVYSKTFPLLFTHPHPDHTEGFAFFTPNFLKIVTMYIMGMKSVKQHVGRVLKKKMDPSVFPIEYKDLKSKRKHRVLKDSYTFFIDQCGTPVAETEEPLFEIQAMQSFTPSHPQHGAMYYRITNPDDGSSIACVWDIESHQGGDVRVINFFQNATVMIHDTQYTAEEYASRSNSVQGFGHSSYDMAFENAAGAGAKYLCSFHYNPRHTDTTLDAIAKQYEDQKAGGLTAPEFIMSREGLALDIENGVIIKKESNKLRFGKP